jgi:hypothetical protein
MNGRIAIEPTLTDVREYLTERGYAVENIPFGDSTPSDLSVFDAIVVTGLNSNVMGIEDAGAKAVVINADGLTPPEVEQRLNSITL